MVAVDSPCASLESGELGRVWLINGPTSIAKVAKQDARLHTLVIRNEKPGSEGQYIRHRPFHGISRTSYTRCTSRDTNA